SPGKLHQRKDSCCSIVIFASRLTPKIPPDQNLVRLRGAMGLDSSGKLTFQNSQGKG
ncbi:unnamed protein product, partial [Coccothraustes coccothraustes]